MSNPKYNITNCLKRQRNILIKNDHNLRKNNLGLPNEILCYCFKRCDELSILRVLVVCKLWRVITLSMKAESTLDIDHFWGELSLIKVHGHSAVEYKNKIYLYGGWGGLSTVNNRLYIVDPSRPRITSTYRSYQISTFAHSGTLIGNKYYIFAGSTEDKYMNSMYCINLDSLVGKIVKATGEIPPVRDYHSAVPLGDKIVVFGGKAYNQGTQWFNDLHVFHTETNTWESIKANGTIPPACGASSFNLYDDTDIILFGGGSWKQTIEHPVDISYYNDIYKLNTKTWTWSILSTSGTPPSPRGGHGSLLVGNHLIITGGYLCCAEETWPSYDDCFLLNLKTLEWKELNVKLKCKIGNHTLSLVGDKIFLIGGIDNDAEITKKSYSIGIKEKLILK